MACTALIPSQVLNCSRYTVVLDRRFSWDILEALEALFLSNLTLGTTCHARNESRLIPAGFNREGGNIILSRRHRLDSESLNAPADRLFVPLIVAA
jgi:hypothetical protein